MALLTERSESMEMINRYVYAVTQKLPPAQREDIAKELIEDMVEERAQGGTITDKDVEEVLLELGNPRHMAQKYRGTKNYLIGPDLFDPYMLVLKIVLTTTIAVILIGFVIQMMFNPISILDHFIDFIVSSVVGLPSAYGWTTLVFAFADYYGIQSKDLETGLKWHPSTLAPIPDEKRQIKKHEPIIGIVAFTLLIAGMMFSHEYFGVWIFDDGFAGTVPFLNIETSLPILFIIVISFLSIIKETLKLIYRKWTFKLATYTMIVNILSLIALIIMVSQNSFWNPNFMQELIELGFVNFGSDGYNVVKNIWEITTFWILVALGIGLVMDTIIGYVKAVKNKKS